MHKIHDMDWLLIGGLGCLALLHPLLNLTGLIDVLGRPLGPWLVTAVISAVWIVTVVLGHVRRPLMTLMFTGLAAGVVVLVAIALVGPAFRGGSGGLLATPIVVVAVLATNTLWGTLAGLVAAGLRRGLRTSRQQEEGSRWTLR